MRPHPRIRRTIKWGGLIVGILIAAVFGVTAWWSTSHSWFQSGKLRTVWLDAGGVVAKWETWAPTPSADQFESNWFAHPKVGPLIIWWPRYSTSYTSKTVWVPLWPFSVAAFGVSVLASRLDLLATRRAKLGACPACSYPRAGLAPSSPCPECGSAAPGA